MSAKRYIQVILPLKLEWNPTYSLPDTGENDVYVGKRVRVLFARKEYVAVVCAVDVVPDVDASRIAEVVSAETNLPDITLKEIELWKFISGYYLCSIGEVFKAAYPVMKLRSEMVVARKVAKGKAETSTPSGRELRCEQAGKPCLLASPRRREEYSALAEETLAGGRSVLVLVPDNDYSQNVEAALSGKFGKGLMIYNSRRTAVQRRKIADALREAAEPHILVGSRLSLFLPFSDLGLIVVDEEQDQLHKQTEPAPRINARDCAAMLAKIHGARLALASATPSLETLLNCRTGKYEMLSAPMAPRAEIIDVSAERRKNGMAGPYSLKLKQMLLNSEGQKVVVRGWEVPEELDGWTTDLFGPESGIEVMTAQSARRLQDRVPLIAVLQADALFPRDDFRADERALQLLQQLGERCDRLVVQTAKSAHPVFNALRKGEDASILLKERKDFSLPPYTRIVDILLDDSSESRKALMTKRLCRKLNTNGLRLVFGRDVSLAGRKSDLYRTILEFEKENKYSSHLHIDVDPL